MDQELEQQIAKRLAELPGDIRTAIESNDTGTHIEAIGKKHALHVDQIGALSDETMLVMLGFSDPAEFAGNISAQARITPAEAAAIAGEINQELFLPIRESMKRFMETKAAAESAAPQISPEKPSSIPQILPSNPAATTPAMPMAEKMLTEKTVVVPTNPTPAPTPSQPAPKPIYKADPYREPVE